MSDSLSIVIAVVVMAAAFVVFCALLPTVTL
jgi:preprotein translocase subunit SecE